MISNFQNCLKTLISQLNRIQFLIEQMINQLTTGKQDSVHWPIVLGNFSYLSRQFANLIQLINSEKLLNCSGQLFLPVQVSVDTDPDLQRITNNRIGAWMHTTVPNYLRTKPEPPTDMKNQQVQSVVQQRMANPEAMTKQVNSFNRCVTSILDILNAHAGSKESEQEGLDMLRPSYGPDELELLIAARHIGTSIRTPMPARDH